MGCWNLLYDNSTWGRLVLFGGVLMFEHDTIKTSPVLNTKGVKHVEVSLMEEGELSIDGQTQPGGNIEIREFEDGEWMGGSYATYENLVEKIKEALED